MPLKDHEFSELKKGFNQPPPLQVQGQNWDLFELHKSWKQVGEKRIRERKKSNSSTRDNQEEEMHVVQIKVTVTESPGKERV